MLQPQQVEELVSAVANMNRPSLTEQFLKFDGPFPTDFTPEFLESLSVERLRHIFVALCMQTSHMPEMHQPTAA